MKKKLYSSFVELSGNRFNSYILRKFTSSPLSKPLNKSFVKYYKINQKEMEKPLNEYRSLQALFVRRLKPGLRPIDNSPNTVVSPVDGIIANSGKINEDSSFLVKGQTYKLSEMLGSKEKGEMYKDGTFVILYLSPSHYHRIHSPISGQIQSQWTLGNRSYPVNELGLRIGKRPLSKNYRLISEMKWKDLRMCVVKVGALNVNSIHVTHPSNEIKKGEELGYFSFGSTVILLFQKDMMELDKNLVIPSELKLGNPIGYLKGE